MFKILYTFYSNIIYSIPNIIFQHLKYTFHSNKDKKKKETLPFQTVIAIYSYKKTRPRNFSFIVSSSAEIYTEKEWKE